MKAFVLTSTCAFLLLGGLLPCGAGAAPPPGGKPVAGAKSGGAKSPAAPVEKRLQFGELTVSDYGSMDLVNLRDYKIEGPNIRLETTDKKRALHLLVFADHIDGQNAAVGHEYVTLTRNVRYTITEQIKVDGHTVQRVINGTARRARYTQSDKTLKIQDDVHATLADPTRFDGPAILSVGSLIAPGEGRYLLAGNAALNDLRFTPLPPAPAKETKGGKKTRTAFQPGMVHAHGFATGSIDTGKEARFDGSLVVIESDNPQTRNRNVFKAPHFLAGLEKDSDSIEATGGVTFDCRQTDAMGNTQTLNGTAGHILSQHGQPLVLEGGVNASLNDPAALKEPATLIATRITAVLGEAPRFVVTGSPQHTRLSFAPRPAPAVGAGAAGDKSAPLVSGANARPADNAITPPASGATDAANPPVINAAPIEIEEADAQTSAPAANAPAAKKTVFVIGDIVVTDFATATYVPDKSLVVDGPRVHFVSSDAATKNDAELQTPHLEADMAVEVVKDKDGRERKVTSLREARATKGATFKFQQPSRKGDPLTLTGTGGTMTFTNKSAQSQAVKVQGLTAFSFVSPSAPPLQGVGHDPDDVLTYDLVTQNLKLVTPQRTFVARAESINAPAPPAAATSGTTKKTTKKKRK